MPSVVSGASGAFSVTPSSRPAFVCMAVTAPALARLRPRLAVHGKIDRLSDKTEAVRVVVQGGQIALPRRIGNDHARVQPDLPKPPAPAGIRDQRPFGFVLVIGRGNPVAGAEVQHPQ